MLSVRCWMFDVRRSMFDVRSWRTNIEHRTSNIERPTSNVQRRKAPSPPALSPVYRGEGVEAAMRERPTTDRAHLAAIDEKPPPSRVLGRGSSGCPPQRTAGRIT